MPLVGLGRRTHRSCCCRNWRQAESAARSRPGLNDPPAAPHAVRQFRFAPATARPLSKIALSTMRDACSTGNELPTGTLTPAPHPLHRIFCPTSAGLVTKVPSQTGHANRTANFAERLILETVPVGYGTITALSARTAADSPANLRPLGVVFVTAAKAVEREIRPRSNLPGTRVHLRATQRVPRQTRDGTPAPNAAPHERSFNLTLA